MNRTLLQQLLSLLCLAHMQNIKAAAIEFHFRTNSSDAVLNDAELELGAVTSFLLEASGKVDEDATLVLIFDDGDKNVTDKLSYTVSNPTYSNGKTYWQFAAHGENPGHATLVLKNIEENGVTTTANYSLSDAFVRFQVFHSQPLIILSDVIGWIYFAAWSISFYPQVYLNWRRKSVIGLNFDFLGLNFAGFLCYTIYNVGLFWIPIVKDEYREAHPYDIMPVEVNDVVFALHAWALTTVTLIQVFIYERADQKLSYVARFILLVCSTAALIIIVIAAIPSVVTFNWLNMVSAFSYIKLGITVIKYIPQAWMNYRRKSTVGWSIGNILLDFTGGTGSILQMFILAYNFNDWASIFLNPVKFGLGALSIIFDVIFMVQHYCLYRGSRMVYNNLSEIEDEEP